MGYDDKAANELVDIIREVIKQELNKIDTTVLCQIEAIKGNDRYDVSIVPDNSTFIRNVVNMTKFDLQVGDYVYIYKIKNQLSNSFICYNIIPVK